MSADGAPPRADDRAEDPEPAQDIAAEQATLGAILLSPVVASELLPVLRPAQFYRPAHGELLAVMADLHRAGGPVDPLTVHGELRRRGRTDFGGRSAAVVLHDLLAATPSPANGRYYAALVAEAAVRRRMVEAGVRLVQLAGPGHGDLDQLMSDVVHELAAIRAGVERHHALRRSDAPERQLSPERALRAVGDAGDGR